MGDRKLSFSLGGGKPAGGKLAFGLGKPPAKFKAPPPAFDAVSDDEDATPAKRRRSDTSDNQEAPDMNTSSRTVCIQFCWKQGIINWKEELVLLATANNTSSHSLDDAEARKVMDKLAEFVAKNGRSFEDVTRQRNAPDGPFKFLFEKNSPEYAYYDSRVKDFEAVSSSTPTTFAGQPSRGPVPPGLPKQEQATVSRQNRFAEQTTPSGPVNTIFGAVHDPVKQKAVAALQQGDSLAAMEAFTRLAAKHDETRPETEAKVALLNETSFDRRRQMAVYKQDGTRGHHMQDFIPPEELAKALAKSGSSTAKAHAAALEEANRIKDDNIGHKLLQKMGWKEGEGLGANNSGIAAPISASGKQRDGLGLGAKAHGEIEEGDDEFESYRKRMMLGYKHRPNPLGNPRKSYY